MMLARQLLPAVRQRLARDPAVALVGPRQCGKTTLAQALWLIANTIFHQGAGDARLAEITLSASGTRTRVSCKHPGCLS